MEILKFSCSGNLNSSMRRILIFIILHLATTKVSSDGAEDAPSHPPLRLHNEEIMAGEDITNLTCEGTRPIIWSYEYYNGTTEVIGKGAKINPQRGGYSHASSLTIDMNSNTQGYYHCHYEGADVNNKNHSASSYVYLYAMYENFADIRFHKEEKKHKSGEDIYLDCRPSQPNLPVTVTRNGKVIHKGPLEDPRRGYVIKNASSTEDPVYYECILHSNSTGKNFTNKFVVRVNGRLEPPWVYIQKNTYNVVGYDMEVACRILDRTYLASPVFSWTYPTKDKGRVTSVTVNETNSENKSFYTSYLKIHNVTLEDSGDYECKVSVQEYHPTKYNKTIQILEKMAPYVNVTSPSRNIILEAGKPFSLKLDILYFPPGGLVLEPSDSKFLLEKAENNTYTFQLWLREVEPEDFGIHRINITTKDGGASQQVLVNMTVKSKTEIFLERVDKSVILEDQSVSVDCTAIGYPLENITWSYQSCPKSHCNSSFVPVKTETTKITYDQPVENKYTSRLTFVATEDARVQCRSGNVAKEKDIDILGDVSTKFLSITIGIVIPFFITLVVLIILLILRVRRDMIRKSEIKKKLEKYAQLFERRPFVVNPDRTADEQADLLPYDDKWEVSRDRIDIGEILGSGTFGQVMKAEVSNLEPDVPTTTVAVKMCKSQEDASQVRALALELKIMLHLGKHLNIVNLLGAHTSMVSNGELWILLEYCHYGSLLPFLHRHRHLFINIINPVTDTISLSGKEGDINTSPFSPLPLKSPDKTNSPVTLKLPAPITPVSPTSSEMESYNSAHTAVTCISAGNAKYPASPRSPTSHPEEGEGGEGSGNNDSAREECGHNGSPPRVFRFDSSSRFGNSIAKNVQMIENPAYHAGLGDDIQPSSPKTDEDSCGSAHKSHNGKESLMAQDSQGNYFLCEKSTIPGVTSSFSTIDLICWAWQVAEGMDYLTRRKVLHGDLAVRNLLLAEDNVIKISDFGLSRDICKNDAYIKQTNELMPVKWMSIEAIRDKIFTIQSDVWAFGVTMWELFTLGEAPYPGMKIDQEFYHTLLNGFRMNKPKHANQELYKIMLQCWNLDPKDRPDFRTLADTLSQMLMPETTNHYNTKNDEYLISNEERFKTETDYLDMMAAPDFRMLSKDKIDHGENSSCYIKMNNTTDVGFHKQEANPSLSPDLNEAGYLLMTSTAGSPKDFDVFSPRDHSKDQVFIFEESPGKMLVGSKVSPSHQLPENKIARESDSSHHRSSCRSLREENEALSHSNKGRSRSVLSDDSNSPKNEEILHSKEHQDADRDYTNIPNSKTYVAPPTPLSSSSSSSSEMTFSQPLMDQVPCINLQIVA